MATTPTQGAAPAPTSPPDRAAAERRPAILVPDAKRVLLTAYADTAAAIAAINEVALDYCLLKPWDPPEEQLPAATTARRSSR